MSLGGPLGLCNKSMSRRVIQCEGLWVCAELSRFHTFHTYTACLHLWQALFPGNTYRHDSGGDPTQIPGLKFEEFQEFHAKYYHPRNARWVGGGAVRSTSAET